MGDFQYEKKSLRKIIIFTAEKHVTENRKFQVTPYGKDMYLFDIFINNGRICMGFKAD